MAIDLFTRRQNGRDFSRNILADPKVPKVDTSNIPVEVIKKTAKKEIRDTDLSFRGKGVMVKRKFRF